MPIAISKDFYTARLAAIDHKNGFPYLSAALYSLVPVITKEVPTLATDKWWRCYINPDFFSKLTVDQGATVLIHELWHPLGLDWVRADAAGVSADTARIWNIARDIEINAKGDLLKRLPALEWQDKDERKLSCTPCKASDFGLEENMIAEEMYRQLLKKATKASIKILGPGCGNCGSCADGEHNAWELPSPGECDTPGQSESHTKRIQMAVATAISNHTNLGRGKVPAGWDRWAKEIMAPRVKWQAELPATIKGAVSHASGGTIPTYRKIGRRQQANPRILPPARLKVTPVVDLIVDTSGSMGEKELGQALGEVHGVLRSLGNGVSVKVFFTDAAAADVQKVTSVRSLKPIGGGGTDMGAGFQAVNANAHKNPGEAPDLVICLTDGITPWPETIPGNYRVVVLLIGSHGEAPSWANPPHGKTIRITEY